MYFLKPRPGANSLKHCRQTLRPYFRMTGPYWPHRLQGRLPFPYLRTFFCFILAMSLPYLTWTPNFSETNLMASSRFTLCDLPIFDGLILRLLTR